MSSEFYTDIQDQVITAIASGKSSLVFWGFNVDCIRLLSHLAMLGVLDSHVSGVVDPDIQKQGKKVFHYEVLAPERVRDLSVDVLVITSDAEKEESLRHYAQVDDRVPEVILSGTEHFKFNDPVFDKILASCLVKSYANGYENSLIHIYQSIKYLAANNINGNVAEFGIFKGGTMAFIAKTLEYFGFKDCQIYGFDIFDGFPSRKTVFDLYSNPKCEFNDYDAVERYCHQYGVQVVKGDICETHKVLENIPLMLSFIDTDNYSPSRAALETCFTQTVRGGVLAFDHYISELRFLYTIGERMAAKEVLAGKNVFHLHGTGIFVKC